MQASIQNNEKKCNDLKLSFYFGKVLQCCPEELSVTMEIVCVCVCVHMLSKSLECG